MILVKKLKNISSFNLSRVVCLLAASAFIVSCSTTGEKVYKTPPVSPTYPATLSWANKLIEFGPDRYVRLLPSITEKSVIVANIEGLIKAYSRETGAPMWEKQYEAAFSAGPVVFGDIVLLGNKNAEVYAVEANNGELVWKQTVSSEVLVPPQLRNNMVVVQTNDGKIFGLRADTGKKVWVYERNVPVLSLRGNSTPSIITDKQVVVGFASGKLVSLSLVDGKLLWESTISLAKGRTELERIIDIDGPIVHQNGVIYVSAYRGRVAAVDADSGSILWTREMSSHLGVVIDKDLLFITDAEGRVWALSRDNGATLWMQDKLSELANTRPAIQGDTLVVGDVVGELYWLAKSDGRLLGHLDHDRVSKYSGATFVADEFSGDELEVEETSVIYQASVVDEQIFVTYQNGILASVRASNTVQNSTPK